MNSLESATQSAGARLTERLAIMRRISQEVIGLSVRYFLLLLKRRRIS